MAIPRASIINQTILNWVFIITKILRLLVWRIFWATLTKIVLKFIEFFQEIILLIVTLLIRSCTPATFSTYTILNIIRLNWALIFRLSLKELKIVLVSYRWRIINAFCNALTLLIWLYCLNVGFSLFKPARFKQLLLQVAIRLSNLGFNIW